MPINGVLHGNLTWEPQPPPEDWAVRFNTPESTENYIDLSSSASFLKKFTVFIAFRIDSMPSTCDGFPLLFKGDKIPTGGVDFDHRYSELSIEVVKDSGVFVAIGGSSKGMDGYIGRGATNYTEDFGQRQTIAVSCGSSSKPTGIRIYKNGVRIDNEDNSSISKVTDRRKSSGNLLMGGYGAARAYSTLHWGFAGVVERIMVVSKVLSPFAVKKLSDYQLGVLDTFVRVESNRNPERTPLTDPTGSWLLEETAFPMNIQGPEYINGVPSYWVTFPYKLRIKGGTRTWEPAFLGRYELTPDFSYRKLRFTFTDRYGNIKVVYAAQQLMSTTRTSFRCFFANRGPDSVMPPPNTVSFDLEDSIEIEDALS